MTTDIHRRGQLHVPVTAKGAALADDAPELLSVGTAGASAPVFFPVRETTTHETIPPHIQRLRASVARWGNSSAKPAQEARKALREAVHSWMRGQG